MLAHLARGVNKHKKIDTGCAMCYKTWLSAIMFKTLLALALVLGAVAGCSRQGHVSGGQQQTYLLVGDSTRATDVAWNPNGSRLAYSTGDQVKYVTLPSTQGVRVAETQAGILTTPSWSAVDPGRIAYVRIDSGGGTATILENDTVGGGLDTIFSYSAGQLGVGFVNPESLCLDLVRPQFGSRIYISAVGNRPGVWAIDTTLGSISFLLEGRWPDVDPSETYLAYAARNGGIRVRNLDSLTTDSVSAAGLYPSWSPDGQQLTYCTDDTVYIWSRTTGEVRRFPMSENVSNLSWRKWPNVQGIAMRIQSDGTVWLLNTMIPGYMSGRHIRRTPLEQMQ
ncbi:MAG: hypothetical protein ACE5JA_02255 [bacterium]